MTLALPRLEHRGFLAASGEFKQKIYTLHGVSLPRPDEVFSFASSSPEMEDSSSTHSGEGSTDNATRDPHGRLISEHFDAPYIDDVAHLSETMRQQQLFQLAWEPRQKKRLDRNTMEAALIRVCQGHFVSISALAKIVERCAIHPAAVSEGAGGGGQAQVGFPQYKTHWRQGYIAVAECSTPSPQGSS